MTLRTLQPLKSYQKIRIMNLACGRQLVSIAKQWQAVDSAQKAFGTVATEYVCQTHTEGEREETE